MLSQLFNKLVSFAAHHQILCTACIALGIICVTWGVEKILEHYIFLQQPPLGYLLAIVGGVGMLWIIQHFILHIL